MRKFFVLVYFGLMKTTQLKGLLLAYSKKGLHNPDIKFIDGQRKSNLKAAILYERTKWNSHFRKIPCELLSRFLTGLCKKSKEFEAASTFDEIMEGIKKFINSDSPTYKGIGELTIYDISVCIGTYLKKPPKKIYLHRGARDGAKILFSSGVLLGVTKLGKFIKSENLPIGLQKTGWNEDQFESFLCYISMRIGKQGRRL